MGRHVRLQEAIDEYEAALKARRRAQNTVRNARQVLTTLQLVVGNVPVGSLEARHMDALFTEKSVAWSESTQATNVGTLRAFERWLQQRGYIPRTRSLLGGYSTTTSEQGKRLWVPMHKFPALLDAAEHPRDRMIVALGLYLFLRSSEIKDLRWQDVNLASGEIHVRIFKSKVADDMPICRELDLELRRWATWVTEHLGRPPAPDMYLVPAKSSPVAVIVNGKFVGRHLDPTLRPNRPVDKTERMIAKVLAAVGYTREDAPRQGIHVLRRSGARALFDVLRNQGYDGALKRVSAMLHHKNVAMTEHYLGLDLERVQRNDLLRGETMFPVEADNVIRMGGTDGRVRVEGARASAGA